MGFKQKYTIEKSYLPNGTKRRSGIKIPRVSFVVAHDTGNPTSTAMQNVTYYKNSCNSEYASAHIFVDDKHIIECIPALTGTPEKAWHVMYNPTQDNIMFGSDADDTAIGVELCYGKNINFKTAYKRYTWVLAYICYKFGINPATHLTGHEFLDPTRKTDPTNALKTGNITFKQLVKDVVKVYNECITGGAKVSQAESATPVVYLNYTVTITTSSLNVRNDASLTAPIVGTLKKGAKVTATKKTNGMYCIGTNKWISANEAYSKHKNNPRGTVKVLADSLNIREKSNFSSKVVGKLAKGKTVKVYEKYNGLYHIGKSKWISANESYVKFTAAASSKKTKKAVGTIKVLCDSLNIRKEASFNSAIVGKLLEGKTAKVYEEKNGLYRIGTNKWVSANTKYVKFSK